MAIRNARFLLSELLQNDRLFRSWRDGQRRHNAYLDDHAALILALLSLYQTDPDPGWFNSAGQLIEEMIQHFSDPSGGFYDTRDDHGYLITRPKDLQDNATPSGNSLAAMALLQFSAYTGRSDLRERAEAMLVSIQELAVRHPTAFGNWLCAIDFSLNPAYEVVILGPVHNVRTQALIETLWETYRPSIISACSDDPPLPNSPPLLNDRRMIDSLPTAYVCQNFICKRPVTSPDELKAQLATP